MTKKNKHFQWMLPWGIMLQVSFASVGCSTLFQHNDQGWKMLKSPLLYWPALITKLLSYRLNHYFIIITKSTKVRQHLHSKFCVTTSCIQDTAVSSYYTLIRWFHRMETDSDSSQIASVSDWVSVLVVHEAQQRAKHVVSRDTPFTL